MKLTDQKKLAWVLTMLAIAIAAFLATNPESHGVSKDVVYWVSVGAAVAGALNGMLPKVK